MQYSDSEIAKLALRMLLDRPKELLDVLEDLSKALAEQMAAAESGNVPSPIKRQGEVLDDFIEKHGSPFPHTGYPVKQKITDLERALSARLRGLPSGAVFKLDQEL